MTFQTIFNNAEAIAINKMKKVAQTISRDGVVRTISLGGQVWEFEVKLPDGPSYSSYRSIIEKIESLDRVTSSTVYLNTATTWLNGYQGNYSNITGTVIVSFTSGNTLNIISGPNLQSGYKFRSGDYIQLGTSGKVYTVVDDVPFSSTTITVHRPIRDAVNTYTLAIAHNVKWNVVCVKFPRWTIFERNQVRWDGPFVFAEAF
jgi:hypothetical protein